MNSKHFRSNFTDREDWRLPESSARQQDRLDGCVSGPGRIPNLRNLLRISEFSLGSLDNDREGRSHIHKSTSSLPIFSQLKGSQPPILHEDAESRNSLSGSAADGD